MGVDFLPSRLGRCSFVLTLVASAAGCGLTSLGEFSDLDPNASGGGGASGAMQPEAGGKGGAPEEHEGGDAGISGGGATGNTGGGTAGGGATGISGVDSGGAVDPVSPNVTEHLFLNRFRGWRAWPTNGLPGNTTTSNPATFSSHPAYVGVFARGNDQTMWHAAGSTPDYGATWSWNSWLTFGSPIGQPLLGVPSATMVSGGSMELAIVGRIRVGEAVSSGDEVHQIFVRAMSKPPYEWSGWAQVSDGNFEEDPAVVFSNPKVVIFGLGTNHRFYFSTSDTSKDVLPGGWTPWTVLPDEPFRPSFWKQAAAAAGDGQLFVAGLDNTGHFYLNSSKDIGKTWAGWKQVPSQQLTFDEAPALSLCPDPPFSESPKKQLNIFGRSPDKKLWNATSIDGGMHWSEMQEIPGLELTSAPAAVSPKKGVVHLVARGPNGVLYLNPYQD